MVKKSKILIIFIFLFLSIILYGQTANIASFNTLHLGWKDQYNIEKIEGLASIISLFDLVGIQEVMKKSEVKKLVNELEIQTNKKWKYHISPYAVGSKKYREYFAYIWQNQNVKLIEKGQFYEGYNFMRQPYGAKFQIGDLRFAYVLVHSIFGKHRSERELEAMNMEDVYNFFKKNSKIVIIGGDFNLPAYDKAFSSLINNGDQITYAIDTNLKTTIGKSDLVSSYDNIFYSYKYMKEWYTGKSGVVDFTNNDHRKVREIISDHLPVFIEINVKKSKTTH